jgi:dephospho-CoA kinase
MVQRFGAGIVAPDGTLDRQAVADVVFNDPEALKDLNGIVHPAVGLEIARRLGDLAETEAVVILDVPLLVESGRDDLASLLVVDIDPELAVARLVRDRGMREDDARARIANQVTRAERRAKADVVIDNCGTLEDLQRQVDAAWATLVTHGEATEQ